MEKYSKRRNRCKLLTCLAYNLQNFSNFMPILGVSRKNIMRNRAKSKKSQERRNFSSRNCRLCRISSAVTNHLNFSMMAATITWIYGAQLENTPERRHKVKGRNSFAFSDLRHIVAKVALSEDFGGVCHKYEELSRKSFVSALLRMVA